MNGIKIFDFESLYKVIEFLEDSTFYATLDNYKNENKIEKTYLFGSEDVQGIVYSC